MAALSLPALRIARVNPLAAAGWAAIWAFLLLFVLYPLTRIFYDAFTTEAGAFGLSQRRSSSASNQPAANRSRAACSAPGPASETLTPCGRVMPVRPSVY